MDFQRLLKELYTYDTLEYYNILQIQIVFYAFFKYSEKRILETFEEENDETLQSILELYETYLDTILKPYIPILLEHLEEFPLLEPFILQLANTLEVSLKTLDDTLQESIAKFLDSGVYEFLKNTIPDTHIFYLEHNELNIQKLLDLLNTNVENDEVVILEEQKEEIKKESKLIEKALNYRKKTLKKYKGIKNLTPMRTKKVLSQSFKNRK